jgi:hypothetical protein
MMIVDPNVADYIYLYFKIIRVKLERFYWAIKFHPIIFSSPLAKWIIYNKYLKISKDIQKDINLNKHD